MKLNKGKNIINLDDYEVKTLIEEIPNYYQIMYDLPEFEYKEYIQIDLNEVATINDLMDVYFVLNTNEDFKIPYNVCGWTMKNIKIYLKDINETVNNKNVDIDKTIPNQIIDMKNYITKIKNFLFKKKIEEPEFIFRINEFVIDNESIFQIEIVKTGPGWGAMYHTWAVNRIFNTDKVYNNYNDALTDCLIIKEKMNNIKQKEPINV